MAECELCNSKSATRKAKVEGVILRVCDECVKFGEEIPTIEFKSTKKFLVIEEPKETLKSNFHIILKRTREKMGLTQEQLAKKLKEKLSVIKKIENGWEPSLNLIRKLEKFFSIKLTEELKEEVFERKSRKEITIGDVVEID